MQLYIIIIFKTSWGCWKRRRCKGSVLHFYFPIHPLAAPTVLITIVLTICEKLVDQSWVESVHAYVHVYKPLHRKKVDNAQELFWSDILHILLSVILGQFLYSASPSRKWNCRVFFFSFCRICKIMQENMYLICIDHILICMHCIIVIFLSPSGICGTSHWESPNTNACFLPTYIKCRSKYDQGYIFKFTYSCMF